MASQRMDLSKWNFPLFTGLQPMPMGDNGNKFTIEITSIQVNNVEQKLQN